MNEMPQSLTYEQAMQLAQSLGQSNFQFPSPMMSFDALVKQQMQLKEQHEKQLLTEG